jgi:ribonuclease P protein component
MVGPTAADGAAAKSGGSEPDRGLSRRQRLTRPSCFREAYDGGRKFVGRHMVLWLRTGEDAALRLGVVSSRRVGGAVERNRARRRLRALFRTERSSLRPVATDLVLVARASCVRAPWIELTDDFRSLAVRAGLMAPPPDRRDSPERSPPSPAAS